jgi:hypothetical protein
MKLFLTGAALALSLGAGGCMGAMHEHHEGMMGGMMGQHGAQDCPNAQQEQHGAAGQDQAGHDHAAADAQAQCPPAGDAQHQHDDQPQN